jgi:hypothetical protein
LYSLKIYAKLLDDVWITPKERDDNGKTPSGQAMAE